MSLTYAVKIISRNTLRESAPNRNGYTSRQTPRRDQRSAQPELVTLVTRPLRETRGQPQPELVTLVARPLGEIRGQHNQNWLC